MTGNNSKGIAGVNWHTKILPIQALDDDSYGDTLSVGRSIFYAIEQGADVINLSLGTLYEDDYVREAIEAATKAGIIVIAASGNDGCECILYPARYAEVIAVGALNTSNSFAGFSAWGAELDIMAPGTSHTTATWTTGNQTSAYVGGVAGTSFAAPMIAGLAALMVSQQSSITPLQIIAALTENTTQLGTTATSIRDARFGFGGVNALASLQRVITAKHEVQAYSFNPIAVGAFLTPIAPKETPGQYLIQACQRPTTPIYELVKSSGRFFTISKPEARRAQELGYSRSLFAYGCLHQPLDTYDVLRGIDIFKEFRNIYIKL